ncbi:hypothetical protein CO058_04145 [candidate division WWE3 bacterium CG_4_9_14_0_2_um_filter_35_11]|uniref:Uncharacterized protein n=1 Tax=candidate division WWE3 bacterium CG_4_9_14_0_2_um_filter_35_11 TaxID=1975077 RepID=A0A2M8EKV3_UNCKA|nr:MAG: hypothetical protein COV25_03420 [candidate division WWE3 bacterium CG10_big_fil_rev_8_21_14_0_10_35_32]PJC23327.1 MAG: hypothetical protein CO058_04145 [candidate division WWE3 bacterium CG_4_9_14_0_2_um_filter_35_11]
MSESELDFEPIEYCGNNTCNQHCLEVEFILTNDNKVMNLAQLYEDPTRCNDCVDSQTVYRENNNRGKGKPGANKGERKAERGGSSHFHR